MIQITLIIIFFALSSIHFYWAFGGKKGLKDSLPSINGTLVLKPGIIACLIVAVGLLFCAILIISKTNFLQIPLPKMLLHYGTKVLSVLFGVRAVGDFKYVGFSKSVKGTIFSKYDTFYYSPLCVLISILCFMT